MQSYVYKLLTVILANPLFSLSCACCAIDPLYMQYENTHFWVRRKHRLIYCASHPPSLSACVCWWSRCNIYTLPHHRQIYQPYLTYIYLQGQKKLYNRCFSSLMLSNIASLRDINVQLYCICLHALIYYIYNAKSYLNLIHS